MMRLRREDVGAAAGVLVVVIALIVMVYAGWEPAPEGARRGGPGSVGEALSGVMDDVSARDTTPTFAGLSKELTGMADWIVSDAGDDTYNGDYTEAGSFGGKPYYTKASPTRYLYWDGLWILSPVLISGPGEYYYGTGSDLPANPWYVGATLSPPAPTVSAWAPPVETPWGPLIPIKAQEYLATSNTSIAAIRVNCRDVGGWGRLRAALYDASEDLIAVTQEGHATAAGGWVELQFAGTYPTLSNGLTYYLAAWAPYPATQVAGNAGVPGDGGKSDITEPPPTYDTWPDPVELTDMAGSYDIEPVVGSDVAGDYHQGAYSAGEGAEGELAAAYSVGEQGHLRGGYSVGERGEHLGAYSTGPAPPYGGQHRAGYSIGVQGSHAGAYSTGEGEGLAGAMSIGEQGSLLGGYSVGEGEGLRGAYSAGPSLALEGRHRGAYSVTQEASGSHAGGYSVGEEASGRHRGSYAIGEALSGELRGAMSIGGTPPSDEFDVLDLIVMR